MNDWLAEQLIMQLQTTNKILQEISTKLEMSNEEKVALKATTIHAQKRAKQQGVTDG